jgi:hypothetical protein
MHQAPTVPSQALPEMHTALPPHQGVQPSSLHAGEMHVSQQPPVIHAAGSAGKHPLQAQVTRPKVPYLEACHPMHQSRNWQQATATSTRTPTRCSGLSLTLFALGLVPRARAQGLGRCQPRAKLTRRCTGAHSLTHRSAHKHAVAHASVHQAGNINTCSRLWPASRPRTCGATLLCPSQPGVCTDTTGAKATS